MLRLAFAFLSFGAFLISCSQPTRPMEPAAVNPAKVQSIVLADSESQAATCASELAGQGAKILYRNEMGLFFTDKAASTLSLSGCRAVAQSNATLQTTLSAPANTTAAANTTDLPALLRLIPAEEIGARSFVKDHPTYDGRKVIVGILDTGVELDHPMLKKTTTGQDKIIDFNDMSGEGRIALAPITEKADGTLPGTDGATYRFNSAGTTSLRFGTFRGSSLSEADALSAKDKFVDVGVIAFQRGGKWMARIDTNGDKSFDDEAELSNFSSSRTFTKLGAKRSLTVSVNFASDGTLNLCFDDGSHGTHVAGIATGYDPSGLQGVAPGAQIVAVKIGDNRLSGGSTTTASMLLAIDYAVQHEVNIINLSFGIAPGSNLGTSAIEKYIDKVALEKGILFSISAGNEGPGLLTVGTPAGANLAITNAAYLSKETARNNYGYLSYDTDNTWFFSSVGPRLDGGWKPTLLAPGTALSSVPLWDGSEANYSGTSMASPQVTGGLALLVSASNQAKLPSDRASITQAVYNSAKVIPSLTWIEQGHGLMNIPAALAYLQKRPGATPVEYKIAVNSPTAPGSVGSGIYVRSRTLGSDVFSVVVTPVFPSGTPDLVKSALKTLRMVPSDSWIRVPSSFWIAGSANSIQAGIDNAILTQPGLHSGKITALDDATGDVVFEIPVTVVSPQLLQDSNQHLFQTDTTLKVGETQRYFLDIPAGTTSVQLDLISDGASVWGQLLDSQGRTVKTIKDTTTVMPQPALLKETDITSAGVYELDVVAPPSNPRPASVHLRVRAFSLSTTNDGAMPDGAFSVTLQNNFDATDLIPSVLIRSMMQKSTVVVKGSGTTIPFNLSDQDVKDFSKIRFTVTTSKEYYDLMTDYPYQVFDQKHKVVASGGLELHTNIDISGLDKLTVGKMLLDISGSFADKAPDSWAFSLIEERVLKNAVTLFAGKRLALEDGQTTSIPVLFPKGVPPSCVTLRLSDATGRLVQDSHVCP